MSMEQKRRRVGQRQSSQRPRWRTRLRRHTFGLTTGSRPHPDIGGCSDHLAAHVQPGARRSVSRRSRGTSRTGDNVQVSRGDQEHPICVSSQCTAPSATLQPLSSQRGRPTRLQSNLARRRVWKAKSPAPTPTWWTRSDSMKTVFALLQCRRAFHLSSSSARAQPPITQLCQCTRRDDPHLHAPARSCVPSPAGQCLAATVLFAPEWTRSLQVGSAHCWL